MRITADTNVLVRAVTRDDPKQGAAAAAALLEAELVAVPLAALCEFVWVMTRGYRRSVDEVATALRTLTASASVEVDRPAVEAGLAFLERGGDFADGVIVFDGLRQGGAVFMSFDRDAVARVLADGGEARLLSA